MGGCFSLSESARQQRKLDQQLRNQHEVESRQVKVLLLGAGESGKSTLFKQFKLLYTKDKKFSTKERDDLRLIIHGQVLKDLLIMVQHCISNDSFNDPANLKLAKNLVRFFGPGEKVGEANKRNVRLDVGIIRGGGVHKKKEEILSVWEDAGFQSAWNSRGDLGLQVQDALAYYMDSFERVAAYSESNLPTQDDVLRARVRTAGIVSEKFMIDGVPLEMYDVGGQRNERRKWIHAFDNVTTLIFVAALSEYDQVLFEDSRVSRQAEAINLFADTVALEAFADISVLLFLNKKDLFREKLATIPFKVTEGEHQRNVDFTGPLCEIGKAYDTESGKDGEFENCYAAATEYMKGVFASQVSAEGQKRLYIHLTNSTDTENIKVVVNTCRSILLSSAFVDGGFIVS